MLTVILPAGKQAFAVNDVWIHLLLNRVLLHSS